jgi:uncharacterized protein YecE (DUF72 family)
LWADGRATAGRAAPGDHAHDARSWNELCRHGTDVVSISSVPPAGECADRGVAARIYVGTAGWSLPRAFAARCGGAGTHLERYSRQFRCVEINSSFYRPHAPATYARWRSTTPADFRFAVKAPRTITHELRLRNAQSALVEFLDQVGALQEKLGPILVQLPPSLQFDESVATEFFDALRTVHDGTVVCEPRHPTWFSPAATSVLEAHRIARVAADPARVPEASVPGGWAGFAYFRLHGSPRTYWSPYDIDAIAALTADLRKLAETVDSWCVFDNTASGSAAENASTMRDLLTSRASVAPE